MLGCRRRLETKRFHSMVLSHGTIEAAMLAIEAGMTMEEINKCSLAASNAQLGYRKPGHGCLPIPLPIIAGSGRRVLNCKLVETQVGR